MARLQMEVDALLGRPKEELAANTSIFRQSRRTSRPDATVHAGKARLPIVAETRLGWLSVQSNANQSPVRFPCYQGNLQGNQQGAAPSGGFSAQIAPHFQPLARKFPRGQNRDLFSRNRGNAAEFRD